MESTYANKIIIFTTYIILFLILAIYSSSHHHKYDIIKSSTIQHNITTYSRLQLKEIKILADKYTLQSEINNMINTIINNAKNGNTYTEYSFNLYETVNDMPQANIMCYDITHKLKAIFIDSDIRMKLDKHIKNQNTSETGEPTQPPSLVTYYCIVTVDTK